MSFEYFTTDLWGLLYLWLISLAGLLSIYFAVGVFFERLSARHPERRIQNRAFSDRATNIRQSLTSLPTIAFYFAAGLWLQANGYTLFALWQPGILNLVIGFAISVVVYDAWFYWAHRMLHLRAFYRFHAQHHVSIAPTAWSNNNDSLVGTFLEQSYFLVGPLVFPFSPLVFIAHKIFGVMPS